MRLVLDAMGGDFAPVNEVAGACLASKELSSDVEIVLVGKEPDIKAALSKADTASLRYSIVHADEVVLMDDEPSKVLKKKRGSSLFRGVELHQTKNADAFISAGNTGAVMSTAALMLGRVAGVSRPTIGSFFPTQSGQPTLLVDVGANVDSKPRFLLEFAVMGGIYAKEILGVTNPKVGLLNVGEERTKGTETVLETFDLLEKSGLNFVGNVEGRDILRGTCDVVVCDGFVGNIVLKLSESFLGILKAKVSDYADRSWINKIRVALILPTMRKILREFDYQSYGGVPLLGVNGVVIIGHGSSSPLAIKNMILRAAEMVNKNINAKIETALRDTVLSTN